MGRAEKPPETEAERAARILQIDRQIEDYLAERRRNSTGVQREYY
jgi:hypothetical protein